MQYFVYILKSNKDSSLYTGYTSNLKERLDRHNNGKISSTKHKIPFEIAYFETHSTLEKALARERYLKSSKAKNLKNSLRRHHTFGGYSSVG